MATVEFGSEEHYHCRFSSARIGQPDINAWPDNHARFSNAFSSISNAGLEPFWNQIPLVVAGG